MNKLVDLGFSAARVRCPVSKRTSGNQYVSLTIMSPALADEGCVEPAQSVAAYLSAEKARELANALLEAIGLPPAQGENDA